MNASCVVLNGDYTYLCTIGWKRAIKLVLAGKVRVLKQSERMVACVGTALRAPAVVALMRIVRTVYRARVPFSKRNILIRDRGRCVYCGEPGRNLTIDHVIPRSRGGSTDFDNCVACCQTCNAKKGPRTPREAGMNFKRRPYQPTIAEFMRLRLRNSGVFEYLVELGVY